MKMSGQQVEVVRKIILREKVSFQDKFPKTFKVLLLNDDYTPMEFVVIVLKRFFGMSEENAILTMLQVHLNGKGVCGSFAKDVAETKVAQVNDFSRSYEHPLLCTMEPEQF